MNYKVSIAGEAIPIRTCKVLERPYNRNTYMEYVMLFLKEKTELVIESETEVKSVVLRPLSLGITPTLRDGKIYITLEKSCKFSVEINGSFEKNLAVFADFNKEKFVPDENTKVFKKGVHNIDTFKVEKDGTTLYIEDGAVINGNILVENCKDITICGYGKISMEKYTYEMRPDFSRCLDIVNCKNVKISDIVIDDSNSWSLRVFGSENVEIENVKIFGCRGNSDGIDVCGSRNVLVKDVFTRVWDDSFVVKAFDTGNTENVLFKDSVLWNDFARPMEVGVELRADKVRNIKFENIDIIHSTTGYPLMGIHHGDRAEVSDITFDNIRIEDTPGAQLFDLRITNSVWNKDDKMGNIRDITFSNINYIGTPDIKTLLSHSRLEGYSNENDIRGVQFHNILIGGAAAVSREELALDVYDFVSDVKITADEQFEQLHAVSSEIYLKKDFEYKNGFYYGTVCVKLENNTEIKRAGKVYLAVSPKNTERETALSYELEPFAKTEFICTVCLMPGKYVFYLKSDEVEMKYSELFVQLDMVLEKGKDIEDCPEYVFKNYYGNETVSIKIGAKNDRLVLLPYVKDNKETEFVLYTAIPVPVQDGEVVFSSEEVDFGEICALLQRKDKLVDAPQLRCPAEITYVFENEPKIKELFKKEFKAQSGAVIELPLKELGIDKSEYIMEIAAKTDETKNLRYPYTLFHSVTPESTSHMFCRVRIVD
ncbi:MAG: hypothetical protein E7389_00225 [Ruminococcaceae bacterium]|nr:hypothetical protein [Oscillospiraceae bacterium]